MDSITDLEYQCPHCQHYVSNTSCGGCVEKAQTMLSKIEIALGSEENSVNQEDISQKMKLHCKIVMQDPSEIQTVDPSNCVYFFPTMFRLNSF